MLDLVWNLHPHPSRCGGSFLKKIFSNIIIILHPHVHNSYPTRFYPGGFFCQERCHLKNNHLLSGHKLKQ